MKKFIIIIISLTLLGCQKTSQEVFVQPYENNEVIEIEDETLEVGQSIIDTQKVVGEKELTYQITRDFNNNEIERELIKERILKEAQPKVIRVGIKEIKTTTQLITDSEIEIIYQEDDQLPLNTEVIIEEGIKGIVKVSTQEVMIKGEVVETNEISREIIVQAKPTIIHIGTKEDTETDYSLINNDDLSWWYSIGGIDSSIEQLIEPYNVYWKIPTQRKVIYLTFDQGYEYNNNTTQILDTLLEKNVKATFFITGSYYDQNKEVVNRMFEEGHIVANHTINHYRAAPTLESNQQTYLDDVILLNEKVEKMSYYHRPPEGGYSNRSLAILHDLGYTTVFWSFAYRDWLVDDQPDPEVAFTTIISQLQPGSIYLLHSVSNTNTQILPDVIDAIHNQGYSIELLP